MTDLAGMIRRERERRQLTQEQLAALIGVATTTIHRWENGMVIPHGSNRQRLEAVLHLTPALENASEEVGATFLYTITLQIKLRLTTDKVSHMEIDSLQQTAYGNPLSDIQVEAHLLPDVTHARDSPCCS